MKHPCERILVNGNCSIFVKKGSLLNLPEIHTVLTVIYQMDQKGCQNISLFILNVNDKNRISALTSSLKLIRREDQRQW